MGADTDFCGWCSLFDEFAVSVSWESSIVQGTFGVLRASWSGTSGSGSHWALVEDTSWSIQ